MKDGTGFKDGLVNWPARPDLVTPGNIARWHKGSVYHEYPDKRTLRSRGGAAIAEGWLPGKPLIGRDTRVLAVGSCFARNFTLWLAEHGFNRAFPESPYNALLRFNADFESPAVIAQQMRWAFGEVDESALLWIDKKRNQVEATEEGRRQVRETLEGTDVLILTLGLSEIWYDKATGEPLWRALTEDTFDPERHVFRVESLEKTLEWLETIERIRSRHLPDLRIIFTVSPIPLKTTFRPVSAVSANSVSKAILRASLDQFLRGHPEELGRHLFYFPAYEFVTTYFVDPFREDNRHLVPLVPGRILSFFVRHFCEPDMIGDRESGSLDPLTAGKPLERVLQHADSLATEDDPQRELLVRIAELEEDVADLQRVCDERQKVIEELRQAADERLRLVEALDRAAAERLALVERLDGELKALRNKSRA
jgi:hypothetical protein